MHFFYLFSSKDLRSLPQDGSGNPGVVLSEVAYIDVFLFTWFISKQETLAKLWDEIFAYLDILGLPLHGNSTIDSRPLIATDRCQ